MTMRMIGLRKACVIWMHQQMTGCWPAPLKVDYSSLHWSEDKLFLKCTWKDTNRNRVIKSTKRSPGLMTLECAAIFTASHQLEATPFYRFIPTAGLPTVRTPSCFGVSR